MIVSAVYSIRWGHKMALVENPTEHLMVQSIVNAFKRILGRPVKAKEPLSTDIVQLIASFYLTSVPSLAELRFLFVLPVGHAGLLRTDELLSVSHFIFNIYVLISIFIPQRKNDQYREGHFSNVCKSGKVSCPVSIPRSLCTYSQMKKILRFQRLGE